MISSGLFVLPGIAFAQSGPSVVLAYALAGVMVLPALLCQAELASAIPRSGGSYVHIERTLGTFAGLFAGLAGWFSLTLKAAFALIGMGAFVELIWPGMDPTAQRWLVKMAAAGFCVGFTALNAITVKGVGQLQLVMVAVLLAVVAAFIAGGFAGGHVQPDRFDGFWSTDALTVLSTAGLVFVSFGGLLGTANIAGEVRRPGRTLPAAMLASLVVVGVLYGGAVAVTVGVSEPEALAGSLTPLSMAAGQFWGSAGVVALAAAAMLAYVTTANGGILEASRAPVAMAHDGLLPGVLQIASRRRQAPWLSVLLTGAFMLAVIVLLEIKQLVEVASTMLILLYVLTCIAVPILRYRRIQNYKPSFRCPGSPVVPLVGVVIYVGLILDMTVVAMVTTGAFAAAGLAWYLAWLRPRVTRESAIAYLVRGLVGKEMYRAGLDEELKQIALERDGRVVDRFDALVAEAPVLDLPEPTDAETLFGRVAEVLADRAGLDAADLAERLKQRERETSTVLAPGLAVPHMVVPGRGVFAMALVRCKAGIRFEGADEPVRLAFVLVGSADERNFHLRALMAIAHIVEEPGFTDRWLGAPSAESLRDLVLLSGRSRHG